jgi:Polysaccharide deacetylase
MKKIVCFTIDVEPDFGGLLPSDSYYGVANLSRMAKIVSKYGIKITAFVTGKTLEDNFSVLKVLDEMNAEVEQHSYGHQVGHEQKLEDIDRGIKTHERIFGKKPYGYRAPQGIITHKEVRALEQYGILYDSSIFPAFFPGRYNRTSFPSNPFKITNSGILEIPVSVIPKIRIPISLSYIQLLGFSTFKLLFSLFELPDILIYHFHTYELGKVQSYFELPMIAKLGYLRAQRLYRDPLKVFEDFVRYILQRGYEPKYMIDLYREILPVANEWNWKE